MIKLDLSKAQLQQSLETYQERVSVLHKALLSKTCKGNDYVGWVEWPNNFDQAEFEKILVESEKVRENADVLLVCGIGGSYLGARAVIEMVNGLYGQSKPEIIFIGNTFSSTYVAQVLEYIKGKSVYCNVISKSGTTTETAIAFRLIKQFLEQEYGKEEAKKRIYATTDANKGTLKTIANKEDYVTFNIPDDIGGRFSVITAVGLFPIAVAGIDIQALMNGTKKAYADFSDPSLSTNTAYQYAVVRRILQEQGKDVEMFVSYESQLSMLAEWWKQLFGESEGKQGFGILPTSANFSTDLHSLGQFVQDGKKVLFETVIVVDKPTLDMTFPTDAENLDGMNYLAGKQLSWVNEMARLGTLEAHVEEGNVPNIMIHINAMDAETFGYLAYFYFRACAISVALLDVNPFDQPGVEVYKKNMFRLLGKN